MVLQVVNIFPGGQHRNTVANNNIQIIAGIVVNLKIITRFNFIVN